jgi:hypothetical protein
LSGSQGFAGTVAGLVARAHVGDPKWTGPSQSAFRSIALPKFGFGASPRMVGGRFLIKAAGF